MKKKRVVIIFILLILLGVIGMFLIKQNEEGGSEDIKDNSNYVLTDKAEKEEYELPSITSTEQTINGTEDVIVHDSIAEDSISDSENNSSNASGEEDKSTSIEELEESDGQKQTEDENTDIVGSGDKTEIELPFVPAN